MLTRLLRVLSVSAAALLIFSAVYTSAQDYPLTDQTDPASLLSSYYNAINLHDYARAYAYWRTPPQGKTLEQFASGFADTASVEVIVRLPILSEGAAGSIYATIPTMLIATRTNGTEQTYTGCFVMWRSNVPMGNATEPDPNWWIHSGRLRTAASRDAALQTLLSLDETTCGT